MKSYHKRYKLLYLHLGSSNNPPGNYDLPEERNSFIHFKQEVYRLLGSSIILKRITVTDHNETLLVAKVETKKINTVKNTLGLLGIKKISFKY